MVGSDTGAAVKTIKTGIPETGRVLPRFTIFFGAAAACIGILGLAGMAFNITVLWSIYPAYKTMAFSTMVLCTVLGTMLAFHSSRPFRGMARIIALVVLAVIALTEAFELFYGSLGGHTFIENQMILIGNAIAGQQTTAISPGTSFFIILWIIGFSLLIGMPDPSGGGSRNKNIVSITGLAFAMVSFTFF